MWRWIKRFLWLDKPYEHKAGDIVLHSDDGYLDVGIKKNFTDHRPKPRKRRWLRWR